MEIAKGKRRVEIFVSLIDEAINDFQKVKSGGAVIGFKIRRLKMIRKTIIENREINPAQEAVVVQFKAEAKRLKK